MKTSVQIHILWLVLIVKKIELGLEDNLRDFRVTNTAFLIKDRWKLEGLGGDFPGKCGRE